MRLVLMLISFFLVSCGSGGGGISSPDLAPQDSQSPVIVSFTHDPTIIDVTNESAEVTISINVTDNIGVVNGANYRISRADSASATWITEGIFELTSGTAQDGIWTAVATIPTSSISGDYNILMTGYFEDAVGNNVFSENSDTGQLAVASNYFELTYGGEQDEPFEAYENIIDGPDQNGFLVQSFSEGRSSSVDCDLCTENEIHNVVAYTADELKQRFPGVDWKNISAIDGDHLISFFADGRNNDDSSYPGVGSGPSDGSFSKRGELSDNRTEGKFTNGDERFYTLSLWAPSDIWDEATKRSVILSQWKQFSGGSPNFEVRLSQEGDYALSVRSVRQDIPFQQIATVIPDQWNHLKYYIKHSTQSDGKITIWLNGVQVFTYEGVTLYHSNKDGYLKFGMYTEMRDERILLFDGIKISNGLNGRTLDEWSQDQN